MSALIAAFVSGLIFALGLSLSGMTQPAKVTAFLDITGDWDPSLAFVMIGAILVHAVLYRLIRRRSSPLFTAGFAIPTRTEIDPRLVEGAALFGIGWGLGGFCPGPAVTALVSGQAAVVIFVIAMLAGMYLYKMVETLRSRRAPALSENAVAGLTTPASPAVHSSQDA
jgi:uncharacterized membrane protein YedE/YeeE